MRQQTIVKNAIFFLFAMYINSNLQFAFIGVGSIGGVGITRASLVIALFLSFLINSNHSISNTKSVKYLKLAFYTIVILALIKIPVFSVQSLQSGVYDLLNYLWLIPLSKAVNKLDDIEKLLKYVLLFVALFSAIVSLSIVIGIVNPVLYNETKAVLDSGNTPRYIVANGYTGLIAFFYALIKIISIKGVSLKKVLYIIFVLMFFIAMVLTYSRKLYLFLFIGSGLVFLLAKSNRSINIRKMVWIGFAVFSFYLTASFLLPVFGIDVLTFENRMLSIQTDVVDNSGTFESRLGYINLQFQFWIDNFSYFFLGVIFTSKRNEVEGLLFTNNGFTEEVLYYGVFTTLFFIASYIKAMKSSYIIWKNSNNELLKKISIIPIVFMLCSLMIFPLIFSLFHTSINISGTVLILLIANKVEVFNSQSNKR